MSGERDWRGRWDTSGRQLRQRLPEGGRCGWPGTCRRGGSGPLAGVCCVGVELQGGLIPRLKHYEAAGAGQRGPSGGRVPSPSSTAPRSGPGHLSEAGEVRAAFLSRGLGSPACGLRIVASPYSSFLGSVRIPCMENTGKGLLSSWPRWGRGNMGTPGAGGLLRVQRSAGCGTILRCSCHQDQRLGCFASSPTHQRLRAEGGFSSIPADLLPSPRLS